MRLRISNYVAIEASTKIKKVAVAETRGARRRSVLERENSDEMRKTSRKGERSVSEKKLKK